MKIAVATSDSKFVHTGHFGEAKVYIIFDCTSGEPDVVDRVKNVFSDMGHELDSEEARKRRGIHGILAGLGVSRLVATAMGPGGKRFFENRDIGVVMVKPGTRVDDAVRITYK
ncbi:MAG: NifB/NifX family molybdenum-iron cluster-binding protein [Desulfurococcales archaeon]|nr:NifB/NifX family molybdenum-iron cluster-binding protein [Desulfurococcales archaeon]